MLHSSQTKHQDIPGYRWEPTEHSGILHIFTRNTDIYWVLQELLLLSCLDMNTYKKNEKEIVDISVGPGASEKNCWNSVDTRQRACFLTTVKSLGIHVAVELWIFSKTEEMKHTTKLNWSVQAVKMKDMVQIQIKLRFLAWNSFYLSVSFSMSLYLYISVLVSISSLSIAALPLCCLCFCLHLWLFLSLCLSLKKHLANEAVDNHLLSMWDSGFGWRKTIEGRETEPLNQAMPQVWCLFTRVCFWS